MLNLSMRMLATVTFYFSVFCGQSHILLWGGCLLAEVAMILQAAASDCAPMFQQVYVNS